MTARTGATWRAGVIAAIFLLASGWICVEATLVPFGSFRMPGAGFFPLLLGITLAVLALAFLATGLMSPSREVTSIQPERSEVLYLLGSMMVAVAVFDRLGFLLTMMAFLLVATKVLGGIRWRTAAVLAVAGSVTASWVFGRLLQINLPAGVLAF